jgi:hypothetical protein
MAFNYARIQKKADRLIGRFGKRAALRRANIDRPCTAVIIDWEPSEVGLKLEGTQHVLISKLDPTTRKTLETPPSHELDVLIFNGRIVRLIETDKGPRPNGDPVYHDYQGLDDGPDDGASTP